MTLSIQPKGMGLKPGLPTTCKLEPNADADQAWKEVAETDDAQGQAGFAEDWPGAFTSDPSRSNFPFEDTMAIAYTRRAKRGREMSHDIVCGECRMSAC